MMRFGAHAFIWATEWTSAGAETAIRGAAEAGLDCKELPLHIVDEVMRRKDKWTRSARGPRPNAEE